MKSLRFLLVAAVLAALQPLAFGQSGTSTPMAPPRPPPILYFEPLRITASAPAAPPPATTPYASGDATDQEQYYLELINRARANPAAEGVLFAATNDPDVLSAYAFFNVNLALMQTEFNALPVRPPLAMNAKLLQAARAHSQDMFTNAFQGHTSTNGDALAKRAADAGYNTPSALGENVFSFAKSVFQGHAGFEVDWGNDIPADNDGMQRDRGHRVNIHADYREVGIGMVLGTNSKTVNNVTTTVGPQLVTQDFGTGNPNSSAFVLGVVYYDLNGNSFYDAGEGIGGVTVNVDGASFHAVTTNAGGYAIPVSTSAANRSMTFTGLGFNGADTAVIGASGNNVKVDFAPAYVPPSVTGPAAASTTTPTAYNFNPVPGATGYDWRSAEITAAGTDGAENLTRVTAATTGSYSAVSTSVKHAGTGSYHLAHPSGDTPAPPSQTLTYQSAFFVQTNANISFRSRLGWATANQVARVQVSTNSGLSWTDVFTQAGSGNSGDASFQLRTASLASFAGQEIRLRFNYAEPTGSYIDSTNDGVGWYVDEVSFSNLVDLSTAVTTAVAAGTTFDFTAPAPGTFMLAVRPIVSGRNLPFGPALNVTASGVPGQPEIAVQQPAGTPLTDGSAMVSFGTVPLNSPTILTFTIVNLGTEPLSGLAVSLDGANAADFSAGALGTTTLNSGASTTFALTLTAAATGARAAGLHITSNDADESSFDIVLAGTAVDVDIGVEQPVGTNLVDGSATVAFGSVVVGATISRTFTVSNPNSEPLTGLALTMNGANAADFTVTDPLGSSVLDQGESTTFTITFAPSAGGARAAAVHIASNDPDENPFDIALTGTGDITFQITTQPGSAVVTAGSSVTFSAAALPLPATIQWRKNGASIAGATQTTFTIASTKLSDAAAYSAVAKKGVISLTSNIAQLGVVANPPAKWLPVAKSATATMTVDAAGNGLTFLWKKDGNPIPAENRITGIDKKTLTIKGAAAADTASYTCVVTGPGGNATGGATDLRVFTAKPDVTDLQGMPDGIISGSYTHQILCDGGIPQTPASYGATGLPPGLSINTKSGLISGKPTKAGTFTIKLTATNSFGSDSTTNNTITIAPFPDHIAGVYAGPVSRNAALNSSQGGRFDLTIASTGKFTGGLTLGATRHALIGALDIAPNGTPLSPSATVTIKRAGALPSLTVTFTLVPAAANSRITGGNASDGTNNITFTGWRHIWHATNNPATTTPKLYTFGLDVPTGVPDIPLGTGFGSFTVAKDGKLNVTGRTADGESFTFGGFVGPRGEILCFRLLYTTNPKGSLLGTLDIDPLDTGSLAASLTGIVSWWRPNGSTTARIYKAGFGPVDLTAFGGPHVNPTVPNMILGLVEPGVADNATVTFNDGGLAAAATNPNATISIQSKSKIPVPAAGFGPAAVKLTLNPATGLFTGSFVLVDDDPRAAIAGNVKRTVPFQGILTLDETNTPVGVGYFLLPQLPADANPPQPATTPTTSPILSGSVLMQKVP